MKDLWAPWRIEYIRSEKTGACFICDALAASDDRSNLIVSRGQTCCVIINRFPYNGGHLMVAPFRHVAALRDLTDDERLEVMRLTEASMQALENIMQPAGFNVGFNFGQAAGAGLEDHVHQHVVPRWVGDTNFMPVLADVKVVPQALEDLWGQLRPALAEAAPGCGENG